MSLDSNKLLARRAIEVWSTGDLSGAGEIFASQYVNHQHSHPDSRQEVRGLEAWKAFITEFRAGFPDFQDEIQLQVAEGDYVVTRFISSGTQTGPFLGLTPTNRRIKWTGTSIDRVQDGRIVESWVNWDMLGMLQQLGATASPASAGR